MKLFYTVKEAAEILGFSTNTVYKYLDEGKLKSKRVGRGRFKIPREELVPYMGAAEKVENILEEKVIGDKISLTKAAESLDTRAVLSGGDFIFVRLFLGFLMLGWGLIFFIWNTNFKVIFWGSSLILASGLVFAGLAMILLSINWGKLKKLNYLTHLFSILVLGFGSFLAYSSGKTDTLVLFFSLLILLIWELIRGLEHCYQNSSSFKEFMYFTFVAFVAVSVFSYFNPTYITTLPIADFARDYKNLFLLCWFGGLGLPIIYLLTPRGLTSKLQIAIFPILALLSLWVSVGLVNSGHWDVAYGLYLYSVVAIFILWWNVTRRKVEEFSYHSLLLTFGWVATSIVLALLSVNGFQERLKDATLGRMQGRLSEVSSDLDYLFTQSEAAIISYVGKLDIKEVISANDSAKATQAARVIYDQVSNLTRVTIYDQAGVAIGVYPTNPFVLGKNFSSRDYFRITKTTLKPYVSSAYESITGSQTVTQIVPVFSGNELVGMVGVSFNLANLSLSYQDPSSGGSVFAFDETGRYVLNLNVESIGSLVSSEIIAQKGTGTFKNDIVLRVFDTVNTPRWGVYIERGTAELVQKLNNINLLVTTIVLVNSGISLAAGLSLSKRWKS